MIHQRSGRSFATQNYSFDIISKLYVFLMYRNLLSSRFNYRNDTHPRDPSSCLECLVKGYNIASNLCIFLKKRRYKQDPYPIPSMYATFTYTFMVASYGKLDRSIYHTTQTSLHGSKYPSVGCTCSSSGSRSKLQSSYGRRVGVRPAMDSKRAPFGKKRSLKFNHLSSARFFGRNFFLS